MRYFYITVNITAHVSRRTFLYDWEFDATQLIYNYNEL
jgi:hypothetical protein